MYKWSDESLKEAVFTSYSYRQVLLKIGVNGNGTGGYKAVKKRIKELQLNTSHFCGHAWQRAPNIQTYDKMSIEEFLQKCSTPKTIKARLLNNSLLKNECYICGQAPFWNNLALTLQLDHIDGNSENNSLDNLRIICPNCHTQTKTYGSKNRIINKNNSSLKIIEVGTKKLKNSRAKYRKVERPTKEELLKLVIQFPILQIANKYNVSDNAIRKWLKLYDIHMPDMRGYWQQKNKESLQITKKSTAL